MNPFRLLVILFLFVLIFGPKKVQKLVGNLKTNFRGLTGMPPEEGEATAEKPPEEPKKKKTGKRS